MKSNSAFLMLFFLAIFCHTAAPASAPSAGFSLPDSVREMTMEYKSVKGLVVLPFRINDSVAVNLILDTGSRNLILFGRKFRKLFRVNYSKVIEFSGLGTGIPVKGHLATGNKVTINEVLGQQIPVVVVGSNNLFGSYPGIHGVIGYDIFVKFEIELNAAHRTITFRPASKSTPPAGYTHVPLKIVDSRPVMKSSVFMDREAPYAYDLMIDTGSSLGLLLKTTRITDLVSRRGERVLGIGFNGPLSGYQTISRKITVHGLEIERVLTGIVSSQWHDNASIGMAVLKDYIVVLNYCESYACFKRNDAS